jgi:hypothetical protein
MKLNYGIKQRESHPYAAPNSSDNSYDKSGVACIRYILAGNDPCLLYTRMCTHTRDTHTHTHTHTHTQYSAS